MENLTLRSKVNVEKHLLHNVKTATYTHGSQSRRQQAIYSKSKEVYRQQIQQFLKYREKQGFAKNVRIEKAVEQARGYIEHLRQCGRSENSINTTISALAKGLNVEQGMIGHADRSALSTRGREKEGYRNATNERICHFAEMVGIRASEYEKLSGRHLLERDGRLWVIVERGKGGKYQEQLISREHEQEVRTYFAGKDADERLFSREEINSSKHCNLHGLRRENAQRAYKEYVREFQNPEARERAKDALEAMFKRNPAKAGRFKREMMERPYIVRKAELREELRENGISEDGRLDRLAVMATAVFNLSHYREGVVVLNYLR